METAELENEIESLYAREGVRKLPHSDSEKLRRQIPGGWEEYGDLIPDLSTYMSGVGGLCGGVRRLEQRPTEELLRRREQLEKSFFDWYPRYARLKPLVTEANVPDLYADLRTFDRLRELLLQLIPAILERRRDPDG